MNLLNSVVLEGIVTNSLSDSESVHFELTTYRKGSSGVEEASVKCFVHGTLLEYASSIKKGDSLRLVGRLSNFGKEVVLVVEHIEKKATIIKSGKYNFIKE